MTIYFCPKCGNPGVKSCDREMCRKCNNNRVRSYANETAARQPRIATTDRMAMQGFNALSQDYLTRRLV